MLRAKWREGRRAGSSREQKAQRDNTVHPVHARCCITTSERHIFSRARARKRLQDRPRARPSSARAATHALNYAPLNYEWHGIMEIINGVRFADANEPARRFAARINAYLAVGNPRPPRRAEPIRAAPHKGP